MKQYAPFPIRPMRLGGVFGVTWQLYKRGFSSMLLFTLILSGLPALISSVLSADMLFSSTSVSGLVLFLVAMLQLCLLAPMYQGVLFTESRQRVYGYSGGLKDLLRTCGHGLKRFYSVWWADVLYGAGVAVAFGIIAAIVAVAVIFSRGISMLFQSGFDITALDWPGYIAFAPYILLIQLLCQVLFTFTALAMPAAAHEGKKGFGALGRSFRLTGRQFGRVLACTILPAAVNLLVSCLVLILTDLTGAVWVKFLLSLIPVIFSLFYAPYFAALRTSLYFDSIAREKEAAGVNTPQEAPKAMPSFEEAEAQLSRKPARSASWTAAPAENPVWAAVPQPAETPVAEEEPKAIPSFEEAEAQLSRKPARSASWTAAPEEDPVWSAAPERSDQE